MEVRSCERCQLSQNCTYIVGPRGREELPIMIIGEGPGQEEDETALPFVGDSGKMLERVFYSVGMSTQQCKVSNMVRCRPPDNRAPKASEVSACYRYLYREILSFDPEIIILLGNTPLKFFVSRDLSITKAMGTRYYKPLPSPKTLGKRNKVYTDKIYTFEPWFHPALLLRQSSLDPGQPKWLTWKRAYNLAKEYGYG